MDSTTMTTISNAIIALISFIIVAGAIIANLINKFIQRCIREKYLFAIITLIESNLDKDATYLVSQLNYIYNEYQNNCTDNYIYKIGQLCNEVGVDLRSGSYKGYYSWRAKIRKDQITHDANKIANKLSDMINLINEYMSINNSNPLEGYLQNIKLIDAADQCSKGKLEKELLNIRKYHEYLFARFEGMLAEKQYQINLREADIRKVKVSKFFAISGWIIGLLGTAVTVYSWLNNLGIM